MGAHQSNALSPVCYGRSRKAVRVTAWGKERPDQILLSRPQDILVRFSVVQREDLMGDLSGPLLCNGKLRLMSRYRTGRLRDAFERIIDKNLVIFPAGQELDLIRNVEIL